MKYRNYKISILLFKIYISSLTIFISNTSMAQNSRDYDVRAVEAYNSALDDKSRGDYENACRGFRTADGLYNNAIYALMQHTMSTEDEREGAKFVADQLQASVEKSKNQASNVCGRSNILPPVYNSPSTTYKSEPSIQNQAYSAPKPIEPPKPEISPRLKQADDLNILAKQQFITNKNNEACSSVRNARSLYVTELHANADTPVLINGLKTNISNSQKLLDDNKCPPPEIFIDNVQKMFDQTAYARVALFTSINVANGNNFSEACNQSIIATQNYSEAIKYNEKARALGEHEIYNIQALDKTKSNLVQSLDRAKMASKTYCEKAGIKNIISAKENTSTRNK